MNAALQAEAMEQRDPSPCTSTACVFGVREGGQKNTWQGPWGTAVAWGCVVTAAREPITICRAQRAVCPCLPHHGPGDSGMGTQLGGEGWAACDTGSRDCRVWGHSSNKLNGEYLKMTLVYCPDQVSGKNIGRLNKETGCFSR